MRTTDHGLPEARSREVYRKICGVPDGGPWRRLSRCRGWVGLTYDRQALDGALGSAQRLDAETREHLRVRRLLTGCSQGCGVNMHDIAREAVALSEHGLEARAPDGAGGMFDEPISCNP